MNHYRPSDLRIVDSYRCDATGASTEMRHYRLPVRRTRIRSRTMYRVCIAVNLIVWGWLFAMFVMGK